MGSKTKHNKLKKRKKKLATRAKQEYQQEENIHRIGNAAREKAREKIRKQYMESGHSREWVDRLIGKD